MKSDKRLCDLKKKIWSDMIRRKMKYDREMSHWHTKWVWDADDMFIAELSEIEHE